MPVIAKLGLLRTFQQTRIYGKLNCVENMLISHKGSDESLMKIFSTIPKELTEKAENLLNFVGLYQKRNLRAGDLSFGQRPTKFNRFSAFSLSSAGTFAKINPESLAL